MFTGQGASLVPVKAQASNLSVSSSSSAQVSNVLSASRPVNAQTSNLPVPSSSSAQVSSVLSASSARPSEFRVPSLFPSGRKRPSTSVQTTSAVKIKSEINSVEQVAEESRWVLLNQVQQLNDQVRMIYEDEGLDYVDTDDLAELFRRHEEAIRMRRKRNDKIFDKIELSKHVDLCFVVDATGSMKKHIEGVKNSITKIVDQVLHGENKTVTNLRLAMVAYRDYEYANRFEILDFTDSVDEFRSFAANVSTEEPPNSDYDLPEDVLGGLNEALKLKWDQENSGSKLIFHICDMPAHGTEFHDLEYFNSNDSDDEHASVDNVKQVKFNPDDPSFTGLLVDDNYPDGDQFGLTHVGIFEQFRQNNIQYHFGKITVHTDIMLKKFQEVSGERIHKFNVKKVCLIAQSVVTAVKETVSSSFMRARIFGGLGVPLTEINFELDPSEPRWSSIRFVKAVATSFEFPSSIKDVAENKPLKRSKVQDINVKIAQNPFAKGSERYAFYGQEIIQDQSFFSALIGGRDSDPNIVLKEYLHERRGNLAKRFEAANQVQTVAAFLAQQYCNELRVKTNSKIQLEFLLTKTLSIEQESGEFRYMSYEERFEKDAKFVRFTNNVDYAIMAAQASQYKVPMAFVDMLTAFSHWTYQVTDKKLMVVDLQGIVCKNANGTPRTVLTDPAIHCSDPTRFTLTNLSKRGMKQFFVNHKCNEFCKLLSLKPVKF